jgi:hypothetical protein
MTCDSSTASFSAWPQKIAKAFRNLGVFIAKKMAQEKVGAGQKN